LGTSRADGSLKKGVSAILRSGNRVKLRGSHIIAIAAVVTTAAAYFGWQVYAGQTIDAKSFPELKPAKFTIVGVSLDRGYKILISNRIAQLVQVVGSDELEIDNTSTTGNEGARKLRVPLDEMLKSLQGDEVALGKLVTKMNDQLRTVEITGSEVVWEASDVVKAIEGDAELKKRLVRDLNVDLEGNPTTEIRPEALLNGIVIRAFVPVNVRVEGKEVTLKAPIMLPYRPRFCADVTKGYEEELQPTQEMIRGHYVTQAQRLSANPNEREDVVTALKNRTDEAKLARLYAEGPTNLLKKAHVIITEDFIESATIKEVEAPDRRKLFDLALNLTPEGRDRMWQYSRKKDQRQLLVVHNGVAIAAPVISHELAQASINITQVPERSLAQGAVDFLNSKGKQ